MKFPIRPLGNRVVVEPEGRKEKSPGGIVLPDSATQKATRGVVIAAGPGILDKSLACGTIPMTLRIGDRVMFTPYAGTEIEHEGKSFRVLTEEDVIATVEG